MWVFRTGKAMWLRSRGEPWIRDGWRLWGLTTWPPTKGRGCTSCGGMATVTGEHGIASLSVLFMVPPEFRSVWPVHHPMTDAGGLHRIQMLEVRLEGAIHAAARPGARSPESVVYETTMIWTVGADVYRCHAWV